MITDLCRRRRLLAGLALAPAASALPLAARSQSGAPAGPTTLLNVSYDVSREFYKDFNAAFAAHWKKSTGQELTLNQSHGGSSRQARSVADGLQADVITMNQHNDIDMLHQRGGLVPANWASRLPHNSSPTTSVSVILVRKGNPKGIRGWNDLGRAGLQVIIPNPKTSGNGRYTYLAAWGASVKGGIAADAARALVTRIFANVPVLDGGGRGATTTFAQRKLGDALVTFESAVPLQRRGPGGRREAQPASALAQGAGQVRQAVPEGRYLHRRRGLRRLDAGAEGPLQRRRQLRPGDPGGQGPMTACGRG